MTLPAEEHLRALCARVEAFTERVSARYPDALTCARGCHDCCQRGLTLTTLEADALRAGLSTLPPEVRARLAARALEDGSGCPALDPEGACEVYPWRPLVCRTHGLAIRFRRPGALPVLDACPKNFSQRPLGDLDGDCVLDQQTLSTVLAALDAALSDQTGRPRGARVALTELLRGG